MSALAQSLASKHIPALDGLRAVAVFVVILYHAGYGSIPGDLGVLMFFVLSGFLITWLLLKERDATGGISLLGFYQRRTLRIFPAYYLFLGLSILAATVLGSPWTFAQATTALTYTANYYQAFNDHSGPQAHIWSLAVEEQFYLLWPALFIVLGSERRLRWGIGALVLAALAWRSALLFAEVDSAYLYNAFDTRLDCLLIGCGLAVLLRSSRVVHALRHTAAHPGLPLVTVALLAYSRSGIGRGWHYSTGFTADAILCAVLIVQLLHLYTARGWRWLEHPITRWLGAISYPMYLWHAWAMVGLRLPLPHAAQVAVVYGITVVLAAASYYAIERPFLALRHHTSTQPASALGMAKSST